MNGPPLSTRAADRGFPTLSRAPLPEGYFGMTLRSQPEPRRFGSYAVWAAAILAASAMIGATSTRAETNTEYLRTWKLLDQARRIRPRQPSGHVRELNINDIEIRELQAAAAQVLPRALVNIGPVSTGCACEDGPNCTDQVWVVASTAAEAKGLLFSRINGAWMLGPVQKWWVEYDRLNDGRRSFAKASEFYEAQRRLLEKMPLCSAYKWPAADPGSSSSKPRSEP